MISNIHILAYIIMLFASACYAPIQFARSVSIISFAGPFSVIQASDSSYIIAGATEVAANKDILIIKINPDGSLAWSKLVGKSGTDYATSIIQTFDGGYAIAGYTTSFGIGGDVFIAKFDEIGNLQWAKAIGGPNDDLGNCVIQTSDSGYAIAGFKHCSGLHQYDFFLIKLGSSGTLQWSKAAGMTSGGERAYSLVQTSDGDYIVSGGYSNDAYLFLIKFSLSGAIEWSQIVSNAGTGKSIVKCEDGRFLVTGCTGYFGSGAYDLYIAKLNSAGDIELLKSIGASTYEYGSCIIPTMDSGFAAVGTWNTDFSSIGDFLFIKFDSSESMQFAIAAGEMGVNEATSIAQTSDSGYIVVGTGAGRLLIIKFTADGSSCIGNTVTPAIMNTIPYMGGPSPSLDTSTSVSVNATPLVTDYFPVITEICTELNISKFENIPQIMELAVSQNPFNSSCAISAPPNATIEIFDINGKCVGAFDKTPFIWTPGEKIASGIYLIRATAKDGQSATKRIVFMK